MAFMSLMVGGIVGIIAVCAAVLVVVAGAAAFIVGVILLIRHFSKKKNDSGKKPVAAIITASVGAFLLITFVVIPLAVTAEASKPKTVELDGVTYRGGFYGELTPAKPEYTGEERQLGEDTVRFVKHDKFDLALFALKEPRYVAFKRLGDELLCREEQWEAAKAFYSDKENFTAFYKIGGIYGAETVKMDGADMGKFAELYEFCSQKKYASIISRRKNETVHIPVYAFDNNTELYFGRESKDGNLSEVLSCPCTVIDGKLYMIVYHENDDEKQKKLECVAIPNELSEYFTGLIRQ